MTLDDTHERDDLAWLKPDAVALEFATLAGVLLSANTVGEVLDRVVRAGLHAVTGADMVSVTLRSEDRRFHTPVETSPLATQLDALQYQYDEGPCVEATRTPGLGVVGCADLAVSTEFPTWGPSAAAAGVHSILAVGLFPAGAPPRMGALNFYSFERGGLDKADRDVALVLAAHASTALVATQSVSAHELESLQLRTALESRDVIGQAKGILMERRGISAEEAFDVLRGASQALNIKLVDIAKTLASRRADL